MLPELNYDELPAHLQGEANVGKRRLLRSAHRLCKMIFNQVPELIQASEVLLVIKYAKELGLNMEEAQKNKEEAKKWAEEQMANDPDEYMFITPLEQCPHCKAKWRHTYTDGVVRVDGKAGYITANEGEVRVANDVFFILTETTTPTITCMACGKDVSGEFIPQQV